MKLFQYVIISMAVHLVLVLVLKYAPNMSAPTKPTAIEILYKDIPKNRKQFVTDPNEETLLDALKKLEKKARYLSKETRRVEEEQIANRSGKTQNVESRQARNAFDKPSITGPGPIAQEARKELLEKNARLQESSISEFIPEVKSGGFTSLNTDQFLYYTFYARINEQLRTRWVTNIRNFVDNYSPATLERLSREPQITEVEVILDANGKYVRSIIHRKSGDRSLDDAAIRAFVLAQPFNNPPSEIVSADGYIHLNYGFYVQLRPRYLASDKK